MNKHRYLLTFTAVIHLDSLPIDQQPSGHVALGSIALVAYAPVTEQCAEG